MDLCCLVMLYLSSKYILTQLDFDAFYICWLMFFLNPSTTSNYLWSFNWFLFAKTRICSIVTVVCNLKLSLLVALSCGWALSLWIRLAHTFWKERTLHIASLMYWRILISQSEILCFLRTATQARRVSFIYTRLINLIHMAFQD